MDNQNCMCCSIKAAAVIVVILEILSLISAVLEFINHRNVNNGCHMALCIACVICVVLCVFMKTPCIGYFYMLVELLAIVCVIAAMIGTTILLIDTIHNHKVADSVEKELDKSEVYTKNKKNFEDDGMSSYSYQITFFVVALICCTLELFLRMFCLIVIWKFNRNL